MGQLICQVARSIYGVNFRELRKAEVQLPRIHLPCTRVNKGKKKDQAVRPGWQQKTTFGEPDGRDTPRLARVVAAFGGAGFPVAASPDMDAWLKTHAAWICPISCALYATGGDVHRMARTRDALILTIRSTRENFRALRRLGVPITPPSPNLLALGRMPEPVLAPLLGHLLDTRTAETVVQSHANAARDEVGQLFGELVALARRRPHAGKGPAAPVSPGPRRPASPRRQHRVAAGPTRGNRRGRCRRGPPPVGHHWV